MLGIDVGGQRFGRLIAVSYDKNSKKWQCKCDCGKFTSVSKYKLTSGHTKSCGCLRTEMSQNPRKQNKYKTNGNITIGYLNDGSTFIFDTDDLDNVKQYYWNQSSYGYIKAGSRQKLALHRLIANCPKGKVVDHINGNIRDNRKANLRICTQHQNSMNNVIAKNNTSVCTGVTWDKSKNKWKAQLMYEYKNIFLGRFNTFEEACIARKAGEEKYFGEYVRRGEIL